MKLNNRYKRWKVLSKKIVKTKVYCMCDCGTKKWVRIYTLKNGSSGSCGCLIKEKLAAYQERRKRTDLLNKTFGNLKVIGFENKGNSHNNTLCIVECKCGSVNKYTYSGLDKKRLLQFCNWGCKLRKQNTILHRVYSRYKFSAKNANRQFRLSVKQFKTITSKPCFYCGVSKNINNGLMGIDRVINEKGYTKSNSVPCCFICNRAKFTFEQKYFMKWIDNLVNYRISLKSKE